MSTPGILAGAAAGLLLATGWKIVVPHGDQGYDKLLFVAFAVMGAADGAAPGYVVARVKGAPMR